MAVPHYDRVLTGTTLLATMTDESNTRRQSFFTVGLATKLEPLPDLSYEIVDGHDYDSDTSDEWNAGHGQRLEPRLTTFSPLHMEAVLRAVEAPQAQESIEAWRKLFVLLDAADPDPHFSHLRAFLDARLQPSATGHESDEADIIHGMSRLQTDTRSPQRALSFRSARLPWTRRGSTATGDDAAGSVRSLMTSIRRPQRRNDAEPRTDVHDLWIGSDAQRRCVRFDVRLDLHTVHLAPWPRSGSAGDAHAPIGETVSDDVSATTSTTASRQSMMHRLLERNFRRGSHASSAVPPPLAPEAWADVPTQALDDSDDEVFEALSPAAPTFAQPRRTSATSSLAQRSFLASRKTTDLGRVDENEDFVPPASPGPREDFLALLRAACSYVPASQAWPSGENDPLPALLMCAMADAFGWEGIMHLCYGKDSPCDRQQMFAPLGRAALAESTRQQKWDALLSWRTRVAQEADTNIDSMPDAVPPQDADLPSFLPGPRSESSVHDDAVPALELDDTSDLSAPLKERRARHTTSRTWDDWLLLFTSLSSWVSAYETTRVHAGLAPELGQKPRTPTPMAPVPSRAAHAPTACVELDARASQHGFWRLPGVPTALRAESGEEHLDYRWASTKLHSAQFGTPLVMGVAGAQFAVRQLATQPWCYNSAWELEYLDTCIFHTPIIQQRFPPPGDAAVASRPAPATHRTTACPYPSADGAWSALDWTQWLSTLGAGQVVVPLVSWQAWWTLLSVLNGADRTDRDFDLQLRAARNDEQHWDPAAVYL